MKVILKNIKPVVCANIMNLIQSILVIKNKKEAKAIQKLIDEYGYADIYVYCTKDKKKGLIHQKKSTWNDYGWDEDFVEFIELPIDEIWTGCELNGKVIFKFRCYKVEEMTLPYTKFGTNEYVDCEEERKWQTSTMNEDEILKLSCLTEPKLYEYLVGKNKGAYAIHISDLELFDKSKELSEFYKANEQMEYIQSLWNDGGLPDKDDYDEVILTKAPKNFCYVEIE